ncbi:MAG: serine/threonine-protein kinase, partial [Fimbriiglobus sp.]
MVTPTSSAEFLNLLKKSGIIPPADLDRHLRDAPPLPPEPAKCAAALVKRNIITPFQARLLLAGKSRGFRIGAYIVRDQVGHGGMGAVFLAEHETLKRRVALKILSGLGQGSDKLAIARFTREARSAAALDHPNIIRMLDVSQHGDIHYLVMEYVSGQTLEQLLAARGTIPPGEAAGYIAQAACGLQHAHEKGFVHRDIKPANLIVSADGTVKILDMGLARSNNESDRLTEMMDRGAILGTADYVAPETAMGHEADIRSDIYSLGSTAFHILIGRPPFEGNATQKLIQH